MPVIAGLWEAEVNRSFEPEVKINLGNRVRPHLKKKLKLRSTWGPSSQANPLCCMNWQHCFVNMIHILLEAQNVRVFQSLSCSGERRAHGIPVSFQCIPSAIVSFTVSRRNANVVSPACTQPLPGRKPEGPTDSVPMCACVCAHAQTLWHQEGPPRLPPRR